MPIKKGLPPWARKTEATKDVRPRLAIVEEIMMKTAPKWDAKRKRFTKKMTITEACDEVWISTFTFRNWRYEDKKIWDYYDNLVKARKEMNLSMMKDYAMDNVMNAVSGSVKLRPMDVVNVSMRLLEKTDWDFLPTIKVETEDKTNPLLSMSRDELTQRIMELSASLNINVKLPDDNNWTNEYASSNDATPSEESTWVEEERGEEEGDSPWESSESK